MPQYCIHTENFTPTVIRDLRSLYIDMDMHLARTRFVLNLEDPRQYLFFLKYSSILHPVATDPWIDEHEC